MLYDFQDEIARVTGAAFQEIPSRLGKLERRIPIGTRYAGLRRFLRTEGFHLSADVLWVVMMGPEAWVLDVHKNWDQRVGLKILYLFDTLEQQIPTIRRVLKSCRWDYTITSFSGAVPILEAETQRKWYCVPQGVKLSRFMPSDAAARLIGFCSYGRRLERIHDSLREFCNATGCCYDYTTTAGLRPGTKSQEHYGQYAWHLTHSIFNLCWPVEVTSPGRVRSFSPITCRWFEAAASGNVILGKAPRDPGFTELFGPDSVLEVDTTLSKDDLRAVWLHSWECRHVLLESARQRYRAYASQWSWEQRVLDILRLADLPQSSCRQTARLDGFPTPAEPSGTV
jgi:hypothetical protein